MNRRDFLKTSAFSLAAPGLLLSSCSEKEDTTSDTAVTGGIEEATGHFSIMQVSSTTSTSSHPDNIGNSYILRTSGGKVIVMDGGMPGDAAHLRSLLTTKYGGTVHQWWISHPHGDHVGALLEILRNPAGITINEIYHSRFSDALAATESGSYNNYVTPLYAIFDSATSIKVNDIQTAGGLYTIDGVNIKVLGVSNPDLLMTADSTSPYNNSSMILRVWDKDKSILFLGDAQQECGDKLLTRNTRFYKYLTVDYVQMAHHGQQGVKESFYKSITFKKCLWPTPSWVWNPASGSTLQTERTKTWIRNKGIGEDNWIVSCLVKDWYLE